MSTNVHIDIVLDTPPATTYLVPVGVSQLPTFEMGPIRPPSEGGGNSLLVRVTRNCPWSRCKFCFGTLYGRNKFELRTVADVEKDIRAIGCIADEIKAESERLGQAGSVNQVVATSLLSRNPLLRSHAGFVTVFNWLASGGRTAFLQDADSLIARQGDLEEIIALLRKTFPSLQRITSYARSKSIYRKSLDELKHLKHAGLSRLHVGLETGDPELLKLVDKGVTADQHIEAGRKAKEAGLELSLYVMPDLGGRALWRQHAERTAAALNAIQPDYIRSRPFIPREGTPLYDDYVAGAFQLSSPHERLREIEVLVTNLHVESRVCFDHFGNSWRGNSGHPLFKLDYEGYAFPQDKTHVLELIKEGLALDESHHIYARDMVSMPRL